jgi:hypothetical protein
VLDVFSIDELALDMANDPKFALLFIADDEGLLMLRTMDDEGLLMLRAIDGEGLLMSRTIDEEDVLLLDTEEEVLLKSTSSCSCRLSILSSEAAGLSIINALTWNVERLGSNCSFSCSMIQLIILLSW